MQKPKTTASGNTFHHLRKANNAVSDRLRVLLIDESQPLLDSLHQWLSLTNTVNIVGKVKSAVSALSMWESLMPDVIILCIPHDNEASTTVAHYLQAIKSLDPHVRIVLLVWDLPIIYRHSLPKFFKTLDAWMLKQNVCEDLLPVLSKLFPNRVPLYDPLASKATSLTSGEDFARPV